MTTDLDPAVEELARRKLTRLIDAIDADAEVSASGPPGRDPRWSHRSTQLVAAVAVAVVLVAAAVVVVSRVGDSGNHLGLATTGPGLDPQSLTEPAGSWSRAADPPFTPRARAFAGTLSDGRVLVWGGEGGDSGTEPPMALDGGIYDPAADEWTAIPPAPVAGPVIGSEANAMLLAGDRLAVVTRPVTSAGSTLSAAVYDVAEQRWHAAPAQHDITFTYDGVAWDGETLALVRVDRADADAGSAVDEPVTLRWRIGDTAWSHGAPAPLGVRFGAGTAFDGARLVVWGGTTSGRDAPPGPDAGATADGAIYDLASDTWEALPAAPLTPRIHPVVLWSNGRLVVCCGVDRLQGGVTELTDVATYDPQAGTWATLPSSPGTGAFPTDSQGFAAGDPPFLLVGQDVGPVFGDGRTYFLRGDRWERVSLNDLHRVGDVVVATTTSPGSLPGDHLFGVQVRTGRGRWIDAAKAPFTNRIEAAVVATGNDLVVVGGYQGDDVQATVGAWVLDLSTH